MIECADAAYRTGAESMEKAAMVRYRSKLSLLLVIGATMGVASVAACRDSDQVVILSDGSRISGLISARKIIVPGSASVVVEEDAKLHAKESIDVLGSIRVESRKKGAPLRAPYLWLVSEGSIRIEGTILGGQGSDWGSANPERALPGGDGSCIYIESAGTVIDGQVVGGPGGQGGRGCKAGDGGDVIVRGPAVTTRPDRNQIVGGRGADGGLPGHMADTGVPGGDGGDAIAIAGTGRARILSRRSVGPALVSVLAQTGVPLPEGEPGDPGNDVTGAQGGAGNPGNHGTSSSPGGAKGGTGNSGIAATGGSGGNGGPGADNCPNVGDKGGAGGVGGMGVGGKGGKGGKGGDGWYNPTTMQYGGPAGEGGDGGIGGAGTGGAGGRGGQGGKDGGSGGDKGTRGTGVGGAAGDGGDGGSNGIGAPGPPGNPGVAGPSNLGPIGTKGATGGECPPG